MTVRDSGGSVVQFNYGEDGLDTVLSATLGGKKEHFLFLARNSKALVHKYGLHDDYFAEQDKGGLQMIAAQHHHLRMKSAENLLTKCKSGGAASFLPPSSCSLSALCRSGRADSFDWRAIEKGSVVSAKRKRVPSAAWSRGNLLPHWEPATVRKIRLQSGEPFFDLEYVDGVVEKRVPLQLWTNALTPAYLKAAGVKGEGEGEQKIPVFLLKPGLPDPAMSYLPLGNTVGACSERIQSALLDYVKGNPDGIVAEGSTASTVTKYISSPSFLPSFN